MPDAAHYIIQAEAPGQKVTRYKLTMDTATHANLFRPYLPTLPVELWLQILENTDLNEEHLWVSVRNTSCQFRDYVERLFMTTYLPRFAISLALPRRDPERGILNWPGAILNSQLVMTPENVAPDRRYVIFVSPLELRNRTEVQNVQELKEHGWLPKERLMKATTWVYTNQNFMSGRPLQLIKDIEWDEQNRRWVWQVEWRQLVSLFYKAKMEARTKKQSHCMRQKLPGSRYRRV
jgi:hypothetical protein